MAFNAVQNGAAPLNTENLRSSTAKADRDVLISAYIRSQQTNLAAYAAEGRAASASWDRKAEDLVTTNDCVMPLSPLLKPRNPDAIVARFSDKDTQFTLQQGSPDQPKIALLADQAEKHAITKLIRGKENVKSKAATAVTPKSTSEDSSRRCTDKPPTKRTRVTVKDIAHHPAKRARSPESIDEDQVARLAERRERRRVKKAIVEPERGLSSDASDIPTRTKKDNGRKSKKVSLAAGLALMHGFSAKNIGKNRLTHKPDPVSGVFIKGKASTKVSVKKTREKPSIRGFSESRFLDKGKNLDDDVASVSAAPSLARMALNAPGKRLKHAQEHSDGPSRSEEGQICDKTLTKAQVANPGLGSTHAVPGLGDAENAEATRHETKSIIWDIELENGALPAASETSERPAADYTVILGTRAVKWGNIDASKVHQALHIQMEHGPSSPQRRVSEAVSPAQRSGRSSSLHPSQSASQFYCTPGCAASNTVSRFFVQSLSPSAEVLEDAPSCRHAANDLSEPAHDVVPGETCQEMNLSADCLDDHASNEQDRGGLAFDVGPAQEDPSPSRGLVQGNAVCLYMPCSPASVDSLEHELLALDGSHDTLLVEAWGKLSSTPHLPLIYPQYSASDRYIDQPGLDELIRQEADITGVNLVRAAAAVPADQDALPVTHRSDFALEDPWAHLPWNVEGSDFVWPSDDVKQGFEEDEVDGDKIYIIPAEFPGAYEKLTDHRDADIANDFSVLQSDPGDEIIASENASEWMASVSSSVVMADMYDARGAEMATTWSFSQGRALLLGEIEDTKHGRAIDGPQNADFEHDIATRLRGHWTPQKF